MNETVERALPANVDAERLVLGSVQIDSARFAEVAAVLKADDFAIEKHRRIFRALARLDAAGIGIDRVTLAEELRRTNELESCDGLSYLVSLDDGLPKLANIDGYMQIVQEKAVLRRTIVACQGLIDRCMLQQDHSAAILQSAESVLGALSGERAKHGDWLTPAEIIERDPAVLYPRSGGSGLDTPWPEVTRHLGGFQAGDLVIVAGRPGMGKSIVGMQCAYHAASKSAAAGFFSLEMSKASLIQRQLAAIARVDAQRLRMGLLNRDERSRVHLAAEQIAALEFPLFIDDTRARTIPAIRAALRKLAARTQPRLIVFDHLQLMTSATRYQSRHHELSEISHALKHLAGELNATIMLLSQLNRECEREKRRPQLADLKESGSIEEDADVVLFVHRPEMYNRSDESLRGVAEFIIAKHRNGPIGKIPMVFQHAFQRFDERYRDHAECEDAA